VCQFCATDQSGDDDHREHHHDGLVDAQQDRWTRERQLYLPKRLPGRRAEGSCGFHRLLVDPTYAEVGQAYAGRQRVDDRRDDTWDGIGLKLLARKLRNPYSIPDGQFDSTWATVAKQIEAAVEESKRINATFVFLYFPSKEEVYWHLAKERVKPIKDFEERIERLSKTAENFCRSQQLLCLDLTSALRQQGMTGEKLYFPIDIHWNERGHLAVAQEIFKFLRDKNIIK